MLSVENFFIFANKTPKAHSKKEQQNKMVRIFCAWVANVIMFILRRYEILSGQS